jgi:hypothetical protein
MTAAFLGAAHALAAGDGEPDRIGSDFPILAAAAAAVAVTGDTSAARLSSHFLSWPQCHLARLTPGFGCLVGVGAVGRSGGVVLHRCKLGNNACAHARSRQGNGLDGCHRVG